MGGALRRHWGAPARLFIPSSGTPRRISSTYIHKYIDTRLYIQGVDHGEKDPAARPGWNGQLPHGPATSVARVGLPSLCLTQILSISLFYSGVASLICSSLACLGFQIPIKTLPPTPSQQVSEPPGRRELCSSQFPGPGQISFPGPTSRPDIVFGPGY